MTKLPHLRGVVLGGLAVCVLLISASSIIQKLHLLGTPQIAKADSSNLGTFSGYAWSENLGWISMSGSNYGVVVQSDGTLAGYAWDDPNDTVSGSDNIGWISFNAADTASCGAVPASIHGSEFSGWAKALSADNNGWDGCISLSGFSPSYQTILNSTGTSQSGTLDGYAWAGDPVGGWISFNCDTGGPTQNNVCATSNYAVNYTTAYIPPPTANINEFQANPPRVLKNMTTQLQYVVTVTGGAICTITGTDGSSYPVTADSALHSVTTNPIVQNTIYTLGCSSNTASQSITVGISPVYKEL